MHTQNAKEFVIGFQNLSGEINNLAISNGFWLSQNKAEKIALMHSELSEALEVIRKDSVASDSHCPEHFALTVELADCVIRIMDFCAYFGLDLGSAIIDKNDYNKTRPYKHGKKF
jgi:NTP pyrophosphatase (non-canonical NTP hydrolase)